MTQPAEKTEFAQPGDAAGTQNQKLLGKIVGLSEREVAGRLKEAGYNELPSAKPRNVFQIAATVLREPMLLLLLSAAGIYFLLGDPKEALILGVFVFVVIGITAYQERKTERALDALRDLSSPRALVIREGEHIRIAGRDVVPGDIVVLAEGDRVPADGFLIEATNLRIDESLLTGEAVPVRKVARSQEHTEIARPGGDDVPYAFSGTLVVRGRGIACVQATGAKTELGKIGKSLANVQVEPTTLQQDATRLIRASAFAATALCGAIAVVYGLTRGDWLRGFLAALSTAMAILPEELPVILTVFLAVGAWRMSRLRVLTRRMPAIEMLGAATVLCVDKTGTLTMNRMAVGRLFAQGQFFDSAGSDVPREFHDLVRFAALASQIDSFDPMDIGIRKFAEGAGCAEGVDSDWELIREYPLTTGLLVVSQVWKPPQRSQFIVACKGAPEAVMGLCSLSAVEVENLSAAVGNMASDGLRVLAVASAQFEGGDLPADSREFHFEFLGLVGLSDPLRATVPSAVQECRTAGIRTVMITGDYAGTAKSIARQAGLGDSADVISGPDFAAIPEDAVPERIANVGIFARMVPEQKLRLVNALKSRGEIVAMTGDGVNDAPALKSAHIGIAMGQRGTDVAREAADLVLLDDDFSSIVHSVRMGRRIFDNLKKAISYAFAIHVPIAGLSLIPVLVKWPLILEPVHIAFLELIIDPACSIVFEAEPEEPDIMSRPPRSLSERLFDRSSILLSFAQGFGILLVLLAVFAAAFYRGQGIAEARTLAFTTLVLANLGLIQANRSRKLGFGSRQSRNRTMWWITAGAMLLLVGVLYVPPLRRLFDFSVLHLDDLAFCLLAGIMNLIWFEGLKAFVQRHNRSRQMGK